MHERKHIILTGAASGLGYEVLLALRALGDDFHVHIVDHAYGHDVTMPEGDEVKFAAVPAVDHVYALINCAGVNRINWLEDLDEGTFWKTMDTNAGAIFKMTKHYLKALAGGGTVLNIVSNASHTPMRGSLAYNASKGAAHIMTLQMARELYGRHNITVFGISPNRLANTPMSAQIDAQVCVQRGWTMEEAQAYQRQSLPTGEETDPRLLAEFIAFLLSSKDRHRYLHGCIIPYGA